MVYNKSYWNRPLLDYIINQLGAQQIPYRPQQGDPFSSPISSTVKDSFQIQTLPKHFIEKLDKVSQESLENLYVFKVNTTNSLLHSLLGLLDSSYQIAPWERREHLIRLFREKLYYDLDKNQTLLQKLKGENLSQVNIQKDLQAKYPNDRLKRFISLYFDINLVIVTEREIEFVPSVIDKHRPTLLFYQYPFGNIAPIIQGDLPEQVMLWSNSKILQSLIKEPIVSTVSTPPVQESPKVEEIPVVPIKEKKVIIVKKSDEVANQEPPKDAFQQLTKKIIPLESEDEKKIKLLIKFSLTELQTIAQKNGIDIKKDGSKPGTCKNRTKQELAELLKEKYTF